MEYWSTYAYTGKDDQICNRPANFITAAQVSRVVIHCSIITAHISRVVIHCSIIQITPTPLAGTSTSMIQYVREGLGTGNTAGESRMKDKGITLEGSRQEVWVEEEEDEVFYKMKLLISLNKRCPLNCQFAIAPLLLSLRVFLGPC
jgi:hypothetical protein